jgi:SAM-dependent methyltransferase
VSEGGDIAGVLARLYRSRFSDADLAGMRVVWRVLVRDFFQRFIAPDATVVDIGAGPCLFINEVRAARRIAIDANPDLAKYAGEGVEAIVTSDLSLAQLEDGVVDCVFVSNFLEHLPDYRSMIALLMAIERKLRAGGTLMVLQPNYRLEPRRYFDFVDHTLVLTETSLAEAVRAVGLEIERMRVRFLPFTSKSLLPKRSWLVALYLRFPPAQWLMGKQTFVLARKRESKA